ncbi:hypothetical protein CJJ23_04555 [Mycoplasmopsis agassizii]|uniref:Peptidase S8/S53 domain-containing protein n=1 Tax=Mycoplasmopsis agassizii TaxID=33922 RepID=A0A269THJ2_9BACT|nr:S8 family serine peptidase [Mycoplasmopsis agassizii]PAK20932.1 hypothetical protein CJJ23_04555 [Mycoplasmopsis agassizii]
MPKAILSVANIVGASVLPVQTVSTVQTQNAKDHLENFKFENIFKIVRNGYDHDNRDSKINEPVEVLVRIKDTVDFDEYEKTKDINNINSQYNSQNRNFLNSLQIDLFDLDFLTISKTTPYISFVFKNRKNLEKNLLILADSENSVSINSYESREYSEFKKASNNTQTYVSYKAPYMESTFEQQFRTVGADKQREKDALSAKLNKNLYNSNIRKIKVGIYEATSSVDTNNSLFEGKTIHYYDKYGANAKYIENDRHSDSVASIIAGKNGIDKLVDDIYSVYMADGDKAVTEINKNGTLFAEMIARYDWLISNGVKVINNSWGRNVSLSDAKANPDGYGYGNESYYLDFIARKYGIINVFAAGNERKRIVDSVITMAHLSHNSVVVGSTDIDGNELSSFSDYRSFDENIITKPLVVAPGEKYWLKSYDKYNNPQYGYERGTSFSTPIVTGLITMLLRNNYNLLGNPAAILAILTAGSKELEGYDEKQSNGLNEKVGAGLVNYELMQKAADNVRSIYVTENSREQIFDLNYLSRGQKLSISTAWLFDAGYLGYGESEPVRPKDYFKKPDWIKEWGWLNIIPLGFTVYFGKLALYDQDVRNWEHEKQVYDQKISEYNKVHFTAGDPKHKPYWEHKENLARDFGTSWYIPTDIDLWLEKLNESTGNWEKVAYSSSNTSNVEFVRMKIKDSGRYRAVLHQYGKTKGRSLSVQGSLTYVIS